MTVLPIMTTDGSGNEDPRGWEILESWGIKRLKQGCDVSYQVELPEGWDIRSSGIGLSDLIDENGLLRAMVHIKSPLLECAVQIINPRYYVERPGSDAKFCILDFAIREFVKTFDSRNEAQEECDRMNKESGWIKLVEVEA